MLAQNKLFFGIILIFVAFFGSSGAFRCYIGSSEDPANIYTEYYPDTLDTSIRCFRYQQPTCSGCVLNITEGAQIPRRCWAGCDDESIKNATWTTKYGVLSDGVCSDIYTNFSQYTFYRDVICCHTDLCNGADSAVRSHMAILPTVLCSILLALLA